MKIGMDKYQIQIPYKVTTGKNRSTTGNIFIEQIQKGAFISKQPKKCLRKWSKVWMNENQNEKSQK